MPIALTFLCSFVYWGNSSEKQCSEFIRFKFKGQTIELIEKIGADFTTSSTPKAIRQSQLDTSCNVFFTKEKRVMIIRQDDRLRPKFGMALSFEFDEKNGEFPYTPADAVLQFKDFGYGGVEFDLRDTCNFTGMSNSVSEDLTIEIEGFREDTIFGKFTGLLLSGGGGRKLVALEDGCFQIHLFRKH